MASSEPNSVTPPPEQQYTDEVHPAPGPESRKSQWKRRKADKAELLERKKAAEQDQRTVNAPAVDIAENDYHEPSCGVDSAQGVPAVAGGMESSTPPDVNPETLSNASIASADSKWLAAVQRGIEYDDIQGKSTPSPATTVVNPRRPRDHNCDRNSQARDHDTSGWTPWERGQPFTLSAAMEREFREIRPSRMQEILERMQATSRQEQADRLEAAQRKAREARGIYHDPQPGVKW
jgi:hypothetical protein